MARERTSRALKKADADTRMPPIPPWEPSLGRIVLYRPVDQMIHAEQCPAILCALPEAPGSQYWGLVIFDMMGPRCVWAMEGEGPGEFVNPLKTGGGPQCP